MWWFGKSKKKERTDYDVHIRYLRMLYSAFQRKYAEFEKVSEERLKFDSIILSLHQHPKISKMLQKPIIYSQKLDKITESSGSSYSFIKIWRQLKNMETNMI